MEWHQLEYFKTVAEVQHVTKAAQQLAVSQPALSRSIAKLENQLGFPLFERRGKNIVLNEYGRIFLEHVELGMQELEKGQKIIRDIIHPTHGRISLAFLHSLGVNLMPRLVSDFRKQFSNVQFKLHQNALMLILEQLEAGEVDLCLCTSAINKKNIAWEALYEEELFLAVPMGHPLADRRSVTLQEIVNEPLITLKKDYGLRKIADEFFDQAGITPNIAFEGEEIMTIAGLVEAGLGVALIPNSSILGHVEIVLLSVSAPCCYRAIGLAWVKNRYMSPIVQKFKDFIMTQHQRLAE